MDDRADVVVEAPERPRPIRTGIGLRMAAARQARGWSQARLTTELEITMQRRIALSTIEKIENGVSTRPRYVAELARTLGVPVEWLLCGVIAGHPRRLAPDDLLRRALRIGYHPVHL